MDENDNIEKSHDLYFHGFLDFFKKYKFNSIKRQHDHHAHRHKNHKLSNFKVKPSLTTFPDENFKVIFLLLNKISIITYINFFKLRGRMRKERRQLEWNKMC